MRLSISIHTTLAGGDPPGVVEAVVEGDISIHTTLAGGDRSPATPLTPMRYFNPHHPRGWRPVRCKRPEGGLT